MSFPGKTKLQRFAFGIAAGTVAALASGWLIHPGAGFAVAVLAFLASVFVADDGAGTFFPLALLFMIAVALVLLVFVGVVLVMS